MKLDLNCDLGEGELPAQTRDLMRCITSANIACGGHAGDVSSMQTCIRLAKYFGVRVGAHPGPWSRSDLGRGSVRLGPDELELLLMHQVGAFAKIARAEGVRFHHIKLHGALYHACEADPTLARCYVGAVVRWWPGAIIYARAGGEVIRCARREGIRVWEEVFADRNYRDDGTLIPRDQPHALLTNLSEIKARVNLLIARGEILTVSNRPLTFQPKTICVHSDSPQALRIACLIRRAVSNSRARILGVCRAQAKA